MTHALNDSILNYTTDLQKIYPLAENSEITKEMLNKLAVASPFAVGVWENNTEACMSFLSIFPLGTQLQSVDISNLVKHYSQVQVERGQHKQEKDELVSSEIWLSEAELMKNLRQLRKLLMLRWIWQDALGNVSVNELVQQLSIFADECIRVAKDCTYTSLIKRYGVPTFKNDKGKKQVDDMAIFAMGKLGANELNLSSDIDLIFVYQGQGDTDASDFNGAKSIENQKFMTRLGQGIIKILDTHNKDGFVFRVDMRLRPWGDGSALVITQKSLDSYLTKNGRAWERFAWLKARVVNHIDDSFHQNLEQIIKPFIFKHYVDYSAFASLREMKTLIENQVVQREDLNNVKLGAGGIRDIEFVVQAYQLIYGGRYHELQVKPCLEAMAVLHDMSYLTSESYDQLKIAYLFLRRLEHGIQAINDKQTQSLPMQADLQSNLAVTLGFSDWQGLMNALSKHRANVNTPFNQLVTQRNEVVTTYKVTEVEKQLIGILNEENKIKLLAFKESKLVNGLSNDAKKHLKLVYPILVKALCLHEQDQSTANIAFPRLLALLESICRRSIYLIMLAENPNATIALIPVLSSSPWIAKELSQYPVLLDTFIQQKYHHLPDKAELMDIMRQRLLRVEENDEETLLSVLRLFKKMQVLAVAASDVVDKRSIMKVSDSLTYIAEVVLETTMNRAFAELIKKYGSPLNNNGDRATAENSGLAIIGYGKLGGFELSYSSDLDIVFIHSLDEHAMTDGEKAISGMQFAGRLVRKMITYLSLQTRDGRGYEIDVRLRPSGNSGMIIVSEKAFEKYQLEQAWYWEHQALVRARAICGDKKLMKNFDKIRHNVLCQKRDILEVQKEVKKMRQKMRDHLGTKPKVLINVSNQPLSKSIEKFHLKQDAGGMVDIEFMAQYAVLAYAYDYPNAVNWTDNVRIFEQLAKDGIWSVADCNQLTEHYLKIRIATHKLALNNKNNIVNASDWEGVREQITDLWIRLLSD